MAISRLGLLLSLTHRTFHALTTAVATDVSWRQRGLEAVRLLKLTLPSFPSAMTCSCTRTEVIEKEPSIYDDYSVYNESQYGYAGKQGPYSESEYGSEYGEVEPGEHGIRRPGSDYSGPDRGSRRGSRAGRYLE